MAWRTSRMSLIVLVLAALSLGIGGVALAQLPDAAAEQTVPAEEEAKGESVFTGATPTLLAHGIIPAMPAAPAGIALQRVHIAPGGHIDTPADDPRLVLVTVEQGAITVRGSVAVTVTRQTQHQETVPADTEFTLAVGDAYLSPAGSGGVLRNAGADEAILLAAIIYPVPDATPTP